MGLDSSAIAKIPLFVYREENPELECVICLTAFEGGEIGRRLGKCGHRFHVDCVDMWLGSHPSCPTCRASVSVIPGGEVSSEVSNVADASGDSVSVSEIVVEVPSSGDEREVGGMVGSGGDASLVCLSASQAAVGLGAGR